MKISEMSGKLKGFASINTNTLSNEFCSAMRKTDAVCRQCYSAAMLNTFRKGCITPWERNSGELSSSLIPMDKLPVINAHSFRLHSHGELINDVHLHNFVNIARKNPFTTFALWTKRKNLVTRQVRNHGQIPSNLIMIYSNPNTQRMLNKVPANFNKVFNVSDSGEVKGGQFECTGKSCIDCMACYRINEHTIVVEKIR